MLLKSVAAVCGMLSFALPSGSTIRDIDFKEFSIPWAESMHHRANSGWFEVMPQSSVQIANGRHNFVEPGTRPQGSPYLDLMSVTYGDLTGDGQEEAAVDLRYGTGGTMNWHYLYVFTLISDVPRVLGIFESGSRADGGLVKAVIENGLLVLDLNDSAKRQGDCCSEGYVRIRYRWSGNRFDETGERYYDDFEDLPASEEITPHPPEIRRSAEVQHYEALVQANPEDWVARRLLLNWYSEHQDVPTATAARLRHVLWTIEHHPDVPLTDYIDTLFHSSWLEPQVLLVDEREQDSFALVRQAWLDQAKLQPANVVVLYRAAIALSRSDPQMAAEWFKQVVVSDFRNRGVTARQLLGRLYADAVMGVTSRTHHQHSGVIDPTVAQSAFARVAREEVENSPDPLMIAEAASWLYKTCRELLVGREHLEYDRLAWQWLKLAESLDNTSERISLYERELARDHSTGGMFPLQPTRIELQANEAPSPLSRVAAICPPDENAPVPQGIVVRLIIATDGTVRFALRRGGASPRSPLLRPALEAARQYRFPPTLRNGTPVEVDTSMFVSCQ